MCKRQITLVGFRSPSLASNRLETPKETTFAASFELLAYLN